MLVACPCSEGAAPPTLAGQMSSSGGSAPAAAGPSHLSVEAHESEHGAGGPRHHRKGHRKSMVHANLAESLKIRQVSYMYSPLRLYMYMYVTIGFYGNELAIFARI